MAKILIAEDDVSLGISLQATLESEKHTVELVEDGKEALDRLKLYSYELAILDVDLPSINGFEICRSYRTSGGVMPVLMLTGKSDITHKEEGFDSGADDYLTKPFNSKELLLRIRALLRRFPDYTGDQLEARGLTLDRKTKTLKLDDHKIEVTAKEFELLEFLMKRPEQYFTVDSLLNEVWNSESDVTEFAVRQLISRIRKKIEKKGARPFIVTSKGLGYKFSN